MTAQEAVWVKVIEDGASVTGFTGAVALTKHGQTMVHLADAWIAWAGLRSVSVGVR